MQASLQIRPLHDNDPATMAAAFQRIGWKKTEAQYRRYLEEQAAGWRSCLVALIDRRFAGYVTLNWQPTYPPFLEAGTPEIQDLNVLPEFQRQRIASRLLDEVEALYCAGPAGGAGVRRRTTPRLASASCLIERKYAEPRVTMLGGSA